MTTYRKIHEHWTETKRVVAVDGEPFVKQVTCCCDVPAGDAMGCAIVRRCKTRCRCACHRTSVVDKAMRLAREWDGRETWDEQVRKEQGR